VFKFKSSRLLHVSNILYSSLGRLYCTCSLIWYVSACINAWKTCHIRLHVQYNLPDDEHKVFETCRRQEMNSSLNLKSAFCWVTLHNSFTMRGKKHKGRALLNKLRRSEIIADVLTHTALSLSLKSLTFSLQQEVRSVCISRHFNLTLRDVAGYCTVVHTCWHRDGCKNSSE